MRPLFHYFSPEFHSEDLQSLWLDLCEHYCADEKLLSAELQKLAPDNPSARERAGGWLTRIPDSPKQFDLNAVLQKHSLDADEGFALVAMVEALLRTPDPKTAYALVTDTLDTTGWEQAISQSENTLGNTSIWGVALGQRRVSDDDSPDFLFHQIQRKLSRATLLNTLQQIMQMLGKSFVFAEDIQQACHKRDVYDPTLCHFSFDLLGEAAVCRGDADNYFKAYLHAIQTIGRHDHPEDTTVSLKLSTLHPRFENLKNRRALKELTDRLLHLLIAARAADVGVTFEAEEADQQELTLAVFKTLLRTDLLRGWGKLGITVQAYGKRALPTLGWLEHLGRELDTPIPVRLVKGAYWDAEIKQAQQLGLEDYPVYTLKANSDLSFRVCARFLLSSQCQKLAPEFATHNALTIAQLLAIESDKPRAFQRLYGLGEALYQQVGSEQAISCRISAPIGTHYDLLPYLINRLLEHGANNRNNPLNTRLHDPLERLRRTSALRNPRIPLPSEIYAEVRANSGGFNYGSSEALLGLRAGLDQNNAHPWRAMPVIDGHKQSGIDETPLYSPHATDRGIGFFSACSPDQIKTAITRASDAWPAWRDTTLNDRCAHLERYAALLEQHRVELIQLCMLEAGKTLRAAVEEVREAGDLCHYYAAQARRQLHNKALPAIAGESNQLQYRGRGVFLCISPWSSPLAIFTDQIGAALVSGNTVLAKPSSKAALIATRATELWLEAGLPADVLQLLPYKDDALSELLLGDYRLAGVAFTGANATATRINTQLAARPGGPLPVLIAETGGLNAMIADSTALPEQLVRDVIRSAFASAGQRCSALRVLYVQEEIADRVLEKLIGAMNELKVGDPCRFDTDIGPIIDHRSMSALHQHIEQARAEGRLLHELSLDTRHDPGYFVPPTLIRLHTIAELSGETFGPVLHLIRYPAERLPTLIDEINRTGYGLTLGIHSRNSRTIQTVVAHAQVGNIYINRDQIGAVAGAQPFGGINLSGTGPKAGGPNYLLRFVQEKTVTRNATACGGSRQQLMDSGED